eukprot:jgi/Orpsp1_1/1181469/evm.model.c7180000077298.1
MFDKNAVSLLYEYCQDKNTSISKSDLNFNYDIDQTSGLYNCKIILNGTVFDKKLSCKTKKIAKNEIAAYVYEKLIKKNNNEVNNKEIEDNKNAISKLNEFCQDKNTKINLSDLIFEYEIINYGYYNCKVTINGKEYDQHLCCKSKKIAKNEIAKYVYDCLMGNRNNIKIFNEETKNYL